MGKEAMSFELWAMSQNKNKKGCHLPCPRRRKLEA